MSTRFRVTARFHLTGRGLTITGLFEGEPANVKIGNLFAETSTGCQVRVRGVEMHVRQTPEGTEYGLAVDESIPDAIQPGVVLQLEEPCKSDHAN